MRRVGHQSWRDRLPHGRVRLAPAFAPYGVVIWGRMLCVPGLWAFAAEPAQADSPAPGTSHVPSSTAQAPTPPSPDAPPSLPSWGSGAPRAFLSGRAIPGFGYGRFELAIGYGQPHWVWGGLEAIGTLTPEYTAAQAGVHISAAIVDLAVMVRRNDAFEHTLIPAADSVRTSDLEQPKQPAAKSTVIDASLWGVLPLGRWLLTWEATFVRPLGQSSPQLLYEEVQRAVIAKDGVLTTKLAAMVNLARSRQLYVGVFGEHLSLFGRSDSLLLRLGPSAWVPLSRHWDVFGYLTWPVRSPDHLGPWESMYGAAGFLYRFATGESPRGQQP